jgi:hypothetical protein
MVPYAFTCVAIGSCTFERHSQGAKYYQEHCYNVTHLRGTAMMPCAFTCVANGSCTFERHCQGVKYYQEYILFKIIYSWCFILFRGKAML